MRSKLAFLSLGFGLVLSLGGAWAQESDGILFQITPQVIEADQSVSWEQPLTKTSRPGVPVVVNIQAEGLAIRIRLTAFAQGAAYLLVVQGEVRQESGGRGSGSATVQSMLVPAGEPMAFFPLGRSPGESGRQMVVLMVVGPVHE